MVLYPCTWPLAPTAAWVWRLAQSLICSYRRGHGNSDPKILRFFFLLLLFTMYLTTTPPQNKKQNKTKNTFGYVFEITNVHIFHIFTFTVYDISVGMWDLTCVGFNQAVTWESAMSSRVCSVSPCVCVISQAKWSQSKSPGCTYVSLPSEVTLHEPIWARHGRAVKGTHREHSSTQHQTSSLLSRITTSEGPKCLQFKQSQSVYTVC